MRVPRLLPSNKTSMVARPVRDLGMLMIRPAFDLMRGDRAFPSALSRTRSPNLNLSGLSLIAATEMVLDGLQCLSVRKSTCSLILGFGHFGDLQNGVNQSTGFTVA